MQIDVANGLKIANMNKPKREDNEEKTIKLEKGANLKSWKKKHNPNQRNRFNLKERPKDVRTKKKLRQRDNPH